MGAEWSGDIKLMPEGVMRERLETARKTIREINEEEARRAKFTPVMRLADRLHNLLHRGVDCDYAYSDWDTPLTACRAEFLNLAVQLTSFGHPDTVGATIVLMEKIIYGPNYRPSSSQLFGQ